MMIEKTNLRPKSSRSFLKVIIFLSFIICFSCQHREVYYNYCEVNSDKWYQGDTLSFTIDSALIATDVLYDIDIELKHTADYPYRNLWLYAKDNLTDSVSALYSSQYLLADAFGKWYGSGFGISYQLTLPYKKGVKFSPKHEYLIKIIHGMRDEPLVGIDKIGIKIAPQQIAN